MEEQTRKVSEFKTHKANFLRVKVLPGGCFLNKFFKYFPSFVGNKYD